MTFSAEASLIEAAHARAEAENSTRDDAFRLWLAECARGHDRAAKYEVVMSVLRGQLKVSRKLSLDAMNER